MAKNLDNINRIKHQNRNPKKSSYKESEKIKRDAFMLLTLELYENLINLPYNSWPVYVIKNVIDYLRLQNVISNDEQETLIKMNYSDLIPDKVMAFAIVQQKYKAYKNRFKSIR